MSNLPSWSLSQRPPRSGRGYAGHEPLRCQQNVDCTNMADITGKMRARWRAHTSTTPFSNACLQAIGRVQSWERGAWQFWSMEQRISVTQVQMDVCNAR